MAPGAKGFIALDELMFVDTEECLFRPEEAVPPITTTTEASTAPPNGK